VHAGVLEVGDYRASPWLTGTVNLGQVPSGTFLTFTIKVLATNVGDGGIASWAHFDNVRIVPVEV
jgi:hypothetical protein